MPHDTNMARTELRFNLVVAALVVIAISGATWARSVVGVVASGASVVALIVLGVRTYASLWAPDDD